MHRRTLTIFFFMLLCTLLFAPQVFYAGPFDLNVIDTPKAYIPYRGDLNFEFSMYDRGGVLGNATLGIADFALLGIYFDVGQLIGSDEVLVEAPGVIARFLLSNGGSFLPPLAVGYSYFMKGEVHKVSGVTVSGLYIVATSAYFLFGTEQSVSYGFRYPVVPFHYAKPENSSLFVGTDIEIGPAFGIKGEIENVRFDRDRWEETFYNLSFGFNVIDVLNLSLELKYSPSIDKLVRLLKISYTTQF